MLPRLCTFISEGVKVNVVQNNLALLIYLMRMVKAILDNSSLYLEKYLHELIPTIVTCIVSKQLCMRPESDNHWALRDFAARLLAQTCKTYNTSTNSIQIRLTRILTKALDTGAPMSSTYGALSALCELGIEVQRTLVMKRVKSIGERISANEGGATITAPEMTKAVDHIRNLFLRVLPNMIKSSKPPPDVVSVIYEPDLRHSLYSNSLLFSQLEDYKTEFGPFFGPILHGAVVRSRGTMTPLHQIGGPAGGFGHAGAKTIQIQSANSQQKIIIVNQSGGAPQSGQKFIQVATMAKQ